MLEPLTQEVLDRRKVMFGTTDREMAMLELEKELLKPAATPYEEAIQEVLRNTKEGLERERELSEMERFDPSLPTAGFVTFPIIGGALAVWRLQVGK